MNEFLQEFKCQIEQKPLPNFNKSKTENIISLIEEGLFDSVLNLLHEYSKYSIPDGKLIFKIIQKINLDQEQKNKSDILKLWDFILNMNFYSSFLEYAACCNMNFLQIIQTRINHEQESKWLRMNLKADYIMNGQESIMIKNFDLRHLLLFLKSAFKNSKHKLGIVQWFELVSILSSRKDWICSIFY